MIDQVCQWLRMEHAIVGDLPGEMSLNCKGQEVLWEKEDILGFRKRRVRLSFDLVGNATDLEILENALELNKHDFLDTAPVFGADQTVKIEQGQAVLADIEGVIRIAALLTFEYTEEE